MEKLLKFYVKVFLSDGQGSVRGAILYTDRSCYLACTNVQEEILHYPLCFGVGISVGISKIIKLHVKFLCYGQGTVIIIIIIIIGFLINVQV